MEQDLARILIPRDRIERRVAELGRQIAETYGEEGEGLIIVPILAGSLIFLADLMRQLPFKMRIGLMTLSSYRGASTQTGGAQLVQDLSEDIAGRHVLIV